MLITKRLLTKAIGAIQIQSSLIKALTVNERVSFSKFNCDSCSKRLEVPECRACDRMVNYFRIFNIPEGYSIDQKTVKEMARDLQKQFHPDKFNDSCSTSLQEKMALYSTYINEAKATLLNDLQRAIYLMELKGVHLEENAYDVDSKFMIDIFEINQSIETADKRSAEELKMRLEGVLKELQEGLQDFFKSSDIQKCKEFVIKYKYLHSALVNVKARIAHLNEQPKEL